MKKKIKKSRDFWLCRDDYPESSYKVHRVKPARDNFWKKEWDCETQIDSFCFDIFRPLFPIGLRPGQKKKVRITIEVIE